MKLKTAIGEDWFEFLSPYLKSDDFKFIEQRLAKEINTPNHELVPSLKDLFNPFLLCPIKDLRVVILNDRPMKELGVNDGLAFSTKKISMDIPKDAVQFFNGIEDDVYDNFNLKQDYDLIRLAKQGVMLLNYSMTLTFKKLGINKGE